MKWRGVMLAARQWSGLQDQSLHLTRPTRMLGASILLCLAGISPSPAQEFTTFDANAVNRAGWLNARWTFHQVWFEQADDLFSEVRRENPDFALAFAYSAVIDTMLYRSSEVNASEALELAKASPEGEAQMTRALVAFARGELQPAEEWLRQFLETYPDDPYARHILGFTLIDQQRPQEGVAELESLLKDRPSYYPAYNHLGYGLSALGRNEEALDAFQLFLKSTPLNPSAHDSVADGLLGLGQREAAIAHLARSVLLEPRFSYGWMHVGDVYSDGGEKALAKLAYERAIKTAAVYGPDFTDSVEKRIGKLE